MIYEEGNFMWAVARIAEGKHVGRKACGDLFYLYEDEHFKPIMSCFRESGTIRGNMISVEDVSATDWRVVE